MSVKQSCKTLEDIKSINASMSSVKISAKLIDRKPKGYFVKVFFKIRIFSIPRMTARAAWSMGSLYAGN